MIKHEIETLLEQQNEIDKHMSLSQTVNIQKNDDEIHTEKDSPDLKHPEDRWGKFLKSIDNDVDDALVIFKGINGEGYGIYAQLPDSNDSFGKHRSKMKPRREDVEKWIQAFEKIDENEPPNDLYLNCSFEGYKNPLKFHIVEYGKNFIRTHLIYKIDENNIEHNSLFFSQTKSYIFVGYCSLSDTRKNKVDAPCKTFCAVEKLANFVRDCELYKKMVTINNIKS